MQWIIAPVERVRHDPGVVAHHLARDPLDPLLVIAAAPRKRHQQDPARVGTLDDQMGDPMARVLVFPDPAPAMTRSGGAANPPAAPCSTARRCSGLRVSR